MYEHARTYIHTHAYVNVHIHICICTHCTDPGVQILETITSWAACLRKLLHQLAEPCYFSICPFLWADGEGRKILTITRIEYQ